MKLDSRFIALKTLDNVLRRKSFTYPTFTKYASNLDKRDKAFAYNIIQGTLRNLFFLNFVIKKASNRDRIDYRLENVLRIGAYQLLFMDSIPDYAATSTTTELAKMLVDNQAATFVNATMRNITRLREIVHVPRTDFKYYLSLRYSFPQWIVNLFLEQFGDKMTERILQNLNSQPELYIRVNRQKTTSENLLKTLRLDKVRVSAVEEFNGYFKLANLRGDPTHLGAYRKGYFIIQDPVFAIPSLILCDNLVKGNYLEIGSSPGGKLTHIVDLSQGQVPIFGIELPRRILQLRTNLKRLGFEDIYLIAADGRNLPFKKGSFTGILIDASCSSLGIIKRHPEIRYIKGPEDVKMLAGLQKELIRSAYLALKHRGLLVYSTCTLTRQENEEMVNYAETLGLKLERSKNFPAVVKSLPGRFDGAFVAQMRKR